MGDDIATDKTVMLTGEFKEVRRRAPVRSKDDRRDVNKCGKFIELFPDKLASVKESAIFQELKEVLAKQKVVLERVRCLALGSVSEEPLLVYQFLLLVLLAELLGISHVTLWDPVFNKVDQEIFNHYKFEVVEKTADSVGTFYFMPHIPVDVLNMVIESEKPKMMLTNNISVYSDKWSDSQLYEKYRFIALLKHSADGSTTNDKSTIMDDDENKFEIAVPRRKRKNKKKIEILKVDHDYTDCYFKNCQGFGLVTSKDLGQSYGTAFSDLSLYIIDKSTN